MRRSERIAKAKTAPAPQSCREGSPGPSGSVPKRARSNAEKDEVKEQKKRPRRRRDLSCLFDLPADVLLEILRHLDPKGLISMSRANKQLRRMLVCQELEMQVWRFLRQGAGAPDPPPSWSEAKWMSFLFTRYCSSCGNGNSSESVRLLRHICTQCMKIGYVEETHFRWNNPDRDVGMLKCIPNTHHHPRGFSQRMGGYTYYWSGDIEEIERQWDAHCEAVDEGIPGAAESFEAFKKAREEYVASVYALAIPLGHWFATSRLDPDGAAAARVRMEKRAEAARQRLYALNLFPKQDIDRVVTWDHPFVGDGAVEITDKVWARMRELLMCRLKLAVESRHASIRAGRSARISGNWESWLSSQNLSTLERKAYACAFPKLLKLPLVKDIMDADPEVDIPEERYQAVADEIPTFAARFIADKRQVLLQTLPRATRSRASDTFDPLELAISTFGAPAKALEPNTIGLGWKALSVTNCFVRLPNNGHAPASLVYKQSLADVAVNLVGLCGLDTASATIKDMDKANERFVCATCPGLHAAWCKNGGAEGVEGWEWVVSKDVYSQLVEVFTWRGALQHSQTKHPLRDGDVKFRRLADLGNVNTLRKAVDDEERQARCRTLFQAFKGWSCNHCMAFQNCRLFTVKQHVITSHGVQNPTHPEDILLDERQRWTFESCEVRLLLQQKSVT
ncbi:hypothetical protein NMY22_g14949 [Coprinellus aureogranulatus]|nr:hypothetical protein NMY22_g14949 [Coprinellus aureogranulatus]